MAVPAYLQSSREGFKVSLALLVDLDREREKLGVAAKLRSLDRFIRDAVVPSVPAPVLIELPPAEKPRILKPTPSQYRAAVAVKPHDPLRICPDCFWSGPRSEYASHRWMDHG